VHLHRAVEAGDEEVVGVLAANVAAMRESADVDLRGQRLLQHVGLRKARGHEGLRKRDTYPNSMPRGGLVRYPAGPGRSKSGPRKPTVGTD
jgi:hypothetical protein